MYLNKYIKSYLKKEFFFIKGRLKIQDIEYFKKKIEEGINSPDNMNSRTNVIGKMTSYNYFMQDKNFLKILLPIMDLTENDQLFTDDWFLSDAWGFKETFSMYTRVHDHGISLWSGVIYLSNADQPLIFPDIQESVKVEEGSFAIFSAFLKHKTKNRITNEDTKYGLSFNFNKIAKF
tara:strand:- start:3363 stop:3893 length:531 start_codon:yes stop_codon:yes gene_type:complete